MKGKRGKKKTKKTSRKARQSSDFATTDTQTDKAKVKNLPKYLIICSKVDRTDFSDVLIIGAKPIQRSTE